MRCDPQEIADLRVRLRYSVELSYEAAGEAEFILAVHAAKTDRQMVVEEQFQISTGSECSLATDPASGNRMVSFAAGPGSIVAKYWALVDIAHRIVDPVAVGVEGPASLPVSTLRFLYPSRYCQADLVQRRAWDAFGHLPRGYGQVRAVRDWINQNFRFKIGASNGATSAIETLRDGVGVCRDFAHTMITFCRALNYPARFVTGVDYGADPALGPPDFHAYVEVFVGGTWFMFDATGISPITGLVRIATGRDAADVSFATIFGPVATGMPRVHVDAVEDPSLGLVAPPATNLAVSTAD
jgi:transglutaminase-like putative cysteine protease